jgi:hypothetical protein
MIDSPLGTDPGSVEEPVLGTELGTALGSGRSTLFLILFVIYLFVPIIAFAI